MILKKYRIGKIGVLDAVYKRVNISDVKELDQKDICSNLCGVGEEVCKITKVNKDRIPLYYITLCTTFKVTLNSSQFRTKNITYVPWEIR